MRYDRLYHYTDRESAAKIMEDGVIRAMPMTLHRDMLARDDGLATPPLVWLTINPILSGTVLTKLKLDGFGSTDLCRVVLPGDYCDEGLAEYTERVGIAHDWWDWVVRTGMMAGDHYTCWRLCDHDIPRDAWLAVEILTHLATDGVPTWEEYRG